MWLIICVRLRPAATTNMAAMVTTVELPKVATAVLASRQPVNTSRIMAPRAVNDMGSLLVKNNTSIATKRTDKW